jgi:hypothetical protein
MTDELTETECYKLLKEEILNELPKLVFLGNELIELDESMLIGGLCRECSDVGYCKAKSKTGKAFPKTFF